MKTLKTATAICITFAFSSMAAASCNAEIIGMLRTTYTETSSSEVAEVTKNVACNSENQRIATSIGISVPDQLEFKFGGSNKTLRQACSEHNNDYFGKYHREIALSFMPVEALNVIKSCFDDKGLGLVATQSGDGAIITVTAAWVEPYDTASPVAQVTRFHATGPVRCNGDILVASSILQPGGLTETCFRTADGLIMFVLNTNKGSKVAGVDYTARPAPINPSFRWSSAGPINGLVCTQIIEVADPHTWADNYFCGDRDYGIQWSSNGALPHMDCTRILEVADPHTWADNYLCVPYDSRVSFTWHSAGAPNGKPCVRWLEVADPHTWDDNYLCYDVK